MNNQCSKIIQVLFSALLLTGCGSGSGSGSDNPSGLVDLNNRVYVQSCTIASESTCYDYGADENPNYAKNECASMVGIFLANTPCPTANRVGSCAYLYYAETLRYYSTGQMPWTIQSASRCNVGVFSPN